MEGIKDKALRYRNLHKDLTFNEVMDRVKIDQTKIFLDPNSSDEELVRARSTVLALEAIEAVFSEVFNQEAVFDRKNN